MRRRFRLSKSSSINQGAHPLDLTAVILHIHSLHPRKLPGDGVVIDRLQEELDVRKHDARGASDNKIDRLTAFLPRLDQAILELPSQAIGFSDESAAIHAGKIRET